MNILFIIPTLRCGGSERVMSILAGTSAERGHSVTLVTFESPDVKLFYPLPESVQLKPLNLSKPSTSIYAKITKNLRRISAIRRALKSAKPDVVLSFLDEANIITAVASRGSGVPFILSERSSPAYYSAGKIGNALRRLAYKIADGIVFQTQTVLQDMPRSIQAKACVVPNPISSPPHVHGKSPNASSCTILHVGRFSKEKRHDLLLRAFASVHKNYPDQRLVLLGEGPLRPDIEQLIDSLGLKDSIHMPGFVKNVFEYAAEADIFVLCSDFEGFPNALFEAMSMGLPVISTDCPYGPGAVIESGINGILVPVDDAEALAEALKHLINNTEMRRRLGAEASKITDRLNKETIVDAWEDCIRSVINRTNKQTAG